MTNLSELTTDIETHAVGLDPGTIAAAISALVGLITSCRNKDNAAAAIVREAGPAEKALLRGAIRRELREQGQRASPATIEKALQAILDAQHRASDVDRHAVAAELTKWDLA